MISTAGKAATSTCSDCRELTQVDNCPSTRMVTYILIILMLKGSKRHKCYNAVQAVTKRGYSSTISMFVLEWWAISFVCWKFLTLSIDNSLIVSHQTSVHYDTHAGHNRNSIIYFDPSESNDVNHASHFNFSDAKEVHIFQSISPNTFPDESRVQSAK